MQIAVIAATILLTAADAPPVPIFAGGTALLPSIDERMTLGVLSPNSTELRQMIEVGINFVDAKTNVLSSPDAIEGRQGLDNFVKFRRDNEAQGATWGLMVNALYPSADKLLESGEGVIEIVGGGRLPAWSPWNPDRTKWIATKYGAVNRKLPKLPFLSLGIFGDYGDAHFFSGLSKNDPAMRQAFSVFGVPPRSQAFGQEIHMLLRTGKSNLSLSMAPSSKLTLTGV